MDNITIYTKDYEFSVPKKWADKYFEAHIKNEYRFMDSNKPVYSSIEEWAEDYGYGYGTMVYNAAKAAGLRPDITFY